MIKLNKTDLSGCEKTPNVSILKPRLSLSMKKPTLNLGFPTFTKFERKNSLKLRKYKTDH